MRRMMEDARFRIGVFHRLNGVEHFSDRPVTGGVRHDDAVCRVEVLVRRTIRAGWVCVVLSALFLYLSKAVEPGQEGSSEVLWAVYLMMARMCGIASFAIGGIAIYNHRWTEGVMMLLLSVVLPVIAFFVHGTI